MQCEQLLGLFCLSSNLVSSNSTAYDVDSLCSVSSNARADAASISLACFLSLLVSLDQSLRIYLVAGRCVESSLVVVDQSLAVSERRGQSLCLSIRHYAWESRRSASLTHPPSLTPAKKLNPRRRYPTTCQCHRHRKISHPLFGMMPTFGKVSE